MIIASHYPDSSVGVNNVYKTCHEFLTWRDTCLVLLHNPTRFHQRRKCLLQKARGFVTNLDLRLKPQMRRLFLQMYWYKECLFFFTEQNCNILSQLRHVLCADQHLNLSRRRKSRTHQFSFHHQCMKYSLTNTSFNFMASTLCYRVSLCYRGSLVGGIFNNTSPSIESLGTEK